MRQSSGFKIHLLLLFPLLLLLLQSGIALLHHHHQGSWYDNKDQFHHITTEAPRTGEVSTQSALAAVFPAAIPAFVQIFCPSAELPTHRLLPVRPRPKSCKVLPWHGRAPPA